MFVRISLGSHLLLKFWLLRERVLVTDTDSLLVTNLLRFFYFWSVIGKLYHLGIYSFPLGCLVCWCIVVHGNFLWSFVFLWFWLYFLFHFWFYLFVPTLFFFLRSLVKSFSMLFIFSKNQLLDLLVFPIIFVVLTSFISTLLYYFLPSSNF